MELKDKIKELRKKKGWSQSILAEEVQSSTASIIRWEGGARVPQWCYKRMLCLKLGWELLPYLAPYTDKDGIRCHLTEKMLRAGTSGEKLASELEINTATLYAYINREMYPYLTTAFRIAKALNTTVSEIWEVVEDGNK